MRSYGRALFFSAIFFLTTLFVSPLAHADDATAKVHFQNGIHLYDQQPPDYEGALAEFRAAEKDKPSPGIKRNIALCLRALHRYGEAIDELEAMLATGGDNLKPATREAGQKMITEMNALIATVKIKIILHKSTDKQASPVIPRVDVTVDDAPVPPEKLGASLRLGPGEHLFVARAIGFGDAMKKASVVSGDRDVLVQLDLLPVATAAELGSLRVHASNPRAAIFIDGVALANGTWEGGLPSGKHHVEARAEGQPTWSRDVDVAPGTRVELEANSDTGAITTPLPPPYENAKPKEKEKPVERYWYMQGGFALFTGTATVDATRQQDGKPNGPWGERAPTDHGFGGLSLVAKIGRKMTKVLSLEIWGELGAMKPVTYPVHDTTPTQDADVTLAYGQIGPELKIHSVGKFQFFAGTGLGLEYDSVTLNNLNGTNAAGSIQGPIKGGGVEGAWLLEGGAQLNFGERFFFQGSVFLDVSGNGSIKDTSSSDRYFINGPWTRGGLRLQFGFDL